jgi:hypothetical protein
MIISEEIVADVKQGGWLVLVRETFSEIYELTLPSGDTHDLSADDVMLLLRQAGMPKLDAEKFMDWVYNFNAYRLFVQDWRAERITLDQAASFGQGQRLIRIG